MTQYPGRHLALYVLCLGALMITLDTTIVNVALPTIQEQMNLPATALVWVVNAYMLGFGGSLLLGGRLGDVYGRRRMFLFGIVLFSAASTACGLANSGGLLIAARGIQGVGGAIVVAVALSLVVELFPDRAERASAIGVYGFVCGSGGGIGLVAGGAVTSALSWHWIFLLNVPIGAAVCAVCVLSVPDRRPGSPAGRLDVWGAITLTSALILAAYAILDRSDPAPSPVHLLGQLTVAALLLVLFIVIEANVRAPLVSLTVFGRPNLAVSNVVCTFWAAGTCAWFLIAALYMQTVLGYTPIQVGLAFLPTNLVMAAFSFGLSARFVRRFGIRGPVAIGILSGTIGYALFYRSPAAASFVRDILPAMLLLGLGAGMLYNPLLLAATNDVNQSDSGLASGLIHTASRMGGALGLAVISNLSVARIAHLTAAGASVRQALTGGYRFAFLLSAACTAAAGLVSLLLHETLSSNGRSAATTDTTGKPSWKIGRVKRALSDS
jgi:EmrB/QacA subfamily drug resistance transporter